MGKSSLPFALAVTILVLLCRSDSTDAFFRHLFRNHHHRSHSRERGLSFNNLVRTIMHQGFRDHIHESGLKEGNYIWKSHNICPRFSTTEDIPESHKRRSFHFTSCQWANGTMQCTLNKGRRHLTIYFDCCSGFKRSRHGLGCEEVSKANVLEEAEKIGLTQFVKAAKTVGLAEKLGSANLTVFAPSNDAFSLDSNMLGSSDGLTLQGKNVTSIDTVNVKKTVAKFQNALLSHVIPEVRLSKNFEDEEVVKTMNPENSTIRINFYPDPYHNVLMTANCVPVIEKDVEASNGAIFSVENHLSAVTESLLDIVKKRPELTTLKTLLATANLVSMLQEGGQLSLLAPTNAAFDRLSPSLRKKITEDQQLAEKIIQNHLLPNVICSAAIPKKAKTRNMLETNLIVEKSEDKKVFIGGAQVIKADIMGSNGVLHIIDDALVPDAVFNFMDLLETKGYTEFIDLVEKAGLTKTLRSASNVTVFVPTNEAIQNLSVALRTKLGNDQELLRSVLLYHVADVEEEIGVAGVFGEHSLSLSSKAGKSINVDYNEAGGSLMPGFSFKQTKTSAQCLPILHRDLKAANGRINIIDGVMMPPMGTIVETLSSDKRFSKFYSLLKKADIAEMMQSDEASGASFTVMAPNNDAFDRVDQDLIDELQLNPDRLRSRLFRHILKGRYCFGDYDKTRSVVQLGETLNQNLFFIGYFEDGVTFSSAKVVKSDRLATNGNVVEIDFPVMFD